MEDRRCEGPERTPHGVWSVTESGTGALCAEAQADGVPCETLGVACDTCDRAVLVSNPEANPSMAAVSR